MKQEDSSETAKGEKLKYYGSSWKQAREAKKTIQEYREKAKEPHLSDEEKTRYLNIVEEAEQKHTKLRNELHRISI